MMVEKSLEEYFPADLSRFEAHLKQPVRMHNIRDKMQKSGKFENIQVENDAEVVKTENGIKIDPISIYAKTQHIFAEVCFKINIPCYWLVQIFE